MTEAFIRAYTPTPRFGSDFEVSHNNKVRLFLDTETTTDAYQNLLFGSCIVVFETQHGKHERRFLFYAEDVPEHKKRIIFEYGRKHGITVLSRAQFVDDVFYRYGYDMRGEIIGFNLPFDISRLAVDYTVSGGSFVFRLSDNYPPITITHVDRKRAFMHFTKGYRGYFLDLKTFCFALTNQSFKLEGACKAFGVEHGKIKVKKHGEITPKYIKYNLRDTEATAELYLKAIERYNMFGLSEPPNQLYSPASIGKNYLRMMGVKPFMVQNPNFSPEILGYVMSAYFGGRVECRIRKTPVKVTYLDFTSMYPTVYCLLGLDAYLKAEKIEFYECTDEVKEFVDQITLERLADKQTWLSPYMHGVALVLPQDDVLPLRSEFEGENNTRNIALNYVSSRTPLWYSIPDIVASKLLSGKTPNILRAICFRAVGRQNLKPISIMGLEISPEADFFQTIIDKRIDVKSELKRTQDQQKKIQLDQLQLILKIIANASSYGIFIEQTVKNIKEKTTVDVYADTHFKAEVTKLEVLGEYFNPIMGVLITSAARLILAMAEAYVSARGGYIAYMDTDSIMVCPELLDEIKAFFARLNPYQHAIDMFKVEDCEDGEPLHNVWFYGVSAKRYCLYTNNKKIVKYSSHGLGHYLDVGGKGLWRTIIRPNDPYALKLLELTAISELTVTKPNILSRLRVLNEGKPYSQQIKPFNFVIVGVEHNGVIPLIPYTDKLEDIPKMGFVDYKSGKTSSELPEDMYWRPLAEVVAQYQNHYDGKYDYSPLGVFSRKHLEIDAIRYIGKESTPFRREAEILGLREFPLTEYSTENFYAWVLGLKPSQVKAWGVSERTLKKIKRKVKMGGDFRRKGHVYRTLLQKYLEALGVGG